MNNVDDIGGLLKEGTFLRLVDDEIYSVLPESSEDALYDRRAALYDAVVSKNIYHKVMWGLSMDRYAEFAASAVTADSDTRYLDAGCGSLLFTAPHYLNSCSRIIAVDISLKMLRRAKKRLAGKTGVLPDHISLLQADITDLPFLPAVFGTVLCLNVLHHIDGAQDVVIDLRRMLTEGGRLFITSLVLSDRLVGDLYLRALHSAGDFVPPRRPEELYAMIADSFGPKVELEVVGNMAFVKA